MAALGLILLFALLALGDIVGRSQLVKFNHKLKPSQVKAFLHELVSSLTEISPLCPDVIAASLLARNVIDNPSLTSLEQLLDYEPGGYVTANEFYVVRQCQALFSKRESIDGIDMDQRAAALETFNRAEVECFKMNKALRDTRDPNYGARAVLIHKMQRKISDLLGPCPSLEELDCGFGPGSNVGCKKNTSVKMKLSSRATATEAAGRHFSAVADHYHAWPGLRSPEAVRGSQWTSVPKSFKTDRGINIEPIINTFVQKGIGTVLRQRLRTAGVNLNDQTANQLLAQFGSNLGDVPYGLATIDLSMASDCIAYLLVLDLLPSDWFHLLDSYRCSECLMPNGTWRHLEKFSAMGNGYTFELESLIFYALLLVVCDQGSIISVYGDDLICPSRCYDQVCDALRLIGFIPNKKKSFASGPFRESCGKDYWYGTQVRPCFLKKDLCYAEVFRLHNFFVRSGWIDSDWMVKYVPSDVRLFGPDGFGDGHLISDWPLSFHKGYQSGVFKFKTYQSKPRKSSVGRGARSAAFSYFNRVSNDSPPSLTLDFERSLGEEDYVVRTLRVPSGH